MNLNNMIKINLSKNLNLLRINFILRMQNQEEEDDKYLMNDYEEDINYDEKYEEDKS